MSNELALTTELIPNTMAAAVEFSSRMAEAKLLPAHLQNRPADCLRVVLQAARWQMDPFAVADKTSVIGTKLMYEGQLVSAVVNSRGKLSKRLDYKYTGEGTNRTLTVSGTLLGEIEPRTIELTHALATKINKNGQMQSNPDQQMAYIGARIWARRHMPELMLGVYTPDEISDGDEDQPKDVTPPESRADPAKLRRRQPKGASAGPIVEGQVETTPAPVDNGGDSNASIENEKRTEPIAIQPPASVAAQAESPAAPAATPAPTPSASKTSLTKGETWVGEVKVVSAQYEDFGNDPGAIVTTQGGFAGRIYHINGGDKSKRSTVPTWQVGNVVKVELLGRNSKALGVIPIVVSAVVVEEEVVF